MKLKLDRKTLDNHIKVFEETNHRKPYIICSDATYSMLIDDDSNLTLFPKYEPEEKHATVSLGTETFEIKQIDKPVKRKYNLWYTVFIDDELETGEVIRA